MRNKPLHPKSSKSQSRRAKARVAQRRRQRLSSLAAFALQLPCMDDYANALA